MGNLFGKECPELQEAKSKPSCGVRWKPPANGVFAAGERNGDFSRQNVDSGVGKINPRDFMLSDKHKQVYVREPGSIGGQQFMVEECSDCDVYLLDNTAALTIDVCTDCRIFTGPCESSIFVRNCKNCTLVLACQQFRARDCSGCTFFLFSATKPVIESSSDLRFACYTLDYFSLAGQFSVANLSVWDNKWSRIFNFTGGEGNWSCLPPGAHHRQGGHGIRTGIATKTILGGEAEKTSHPDYVANHLPEAARQRAGYTDHTNGAVVPITAGVRDLKPEDETCFVAVMPSHIDVILGKLLALGGGGAAPSSATTCRLLRTKLFHPQKAQSKSFFEGASADMIALASSAPVLGMQWAGSGGRETAMSLLLAAGVITSVAEPTTTSNGTGCGIGGNGQFFMADGPEASATKAKVFFEQWGEDMGTSLLCG
ncbi:unnamed protein product [Ascophyllum nodosum]